MPSFTCVITLTLIAALAGCGGQHVPKHMPPHEAGRTPSPAESSALEAQLKNLETIGIRLNVGISPADLLSSSQRGDYISNPYSDLISDMGYEVDRPPFDSSLSDNVLTVDFEGFYSLDTYHRLATRLATIAGTPDLFTSFSAVEDVDKGVIRISYTTPLVTRSLIAHINTDWLDSSVVNQLLADTENPDTPFYSMSYADPMVVIAATPEDAILVNSWIGKEEFTRIVNPKPRVLHAPLRRP